MLLSSCQNCQVNVVSLFQVQETQESCGELRRQKDAKWDLGGTRYGGVCFQNSRFYLCVSCSFTHGYSKFAFISDISDGLGIKDRII